MGSPRVAWALVATAWTVTVGLSACGDEDPVVGDGRSAAIVEQAIRVAVDPAPEGEPAPVVFVVGAEGATFPVAVQVDVAAALVDDYDLRFADDRSEALDEEAEGVPVIDGGVLITVGDIPEDGRRVDVPVERYRTEDERDQLVVSMRWSDPDWAVTSTSVAPMTG